ncbi:MAG: FHA domain-containing protein [Deltaproteobacteria bacterium]|jgi:3',5'-cyclic-nucleotide phosphodiesterase|nr:FHA domain-containing protein [Deltaproteobacteria bacterium]
MTTLYIIDGHDKRQTIEFGGDSLLLGRSPDSDIQIKDHFVSRKHLRISRKGSRIFIKDLNSRNGTFVNGEPINPGIEVELPEGVPVVMGMTVLCFGKGCAEEIQGFLGSIDVAGLEPEEMEGLAEDRPLTAQKNMELMIRVSDLLTRSTDIRETLKEILNCIFELLVRIDRAAIILLDSEKAKIKEVIYRMREGVDDQRFSTEVLEHVIQLKEAFMISDADTQQGEDVPDTLKLLNIKSVMCVPLLNRAKLVGVLYVDSIKKPYGFRGEDLHLLSAMSSPVAMAIENAPLDPG